MDTQQGGIPGDQVEVRGAGVLHEFEESVNLGHGT
jgi:hypothetical protein